MAEECTVKVSVAGVDLIGRSDSDIKPRFGDSVELSTEGRMESPGGQHGDEKENRSLPAVCRLALEGRSIDDNSESEKTTGRLTKSTKPPADSTGSKDASARKAVMDDEELARMAREEGCVAVVFPGSVTRDSCCKFVCEILKCLLYQRQQLPMTYDQLVSYQRKQQSAWVEDVVSRKVVNPGAWDWRKCHRTLQDLDEVLQHLENLFSLSRVPRVLLLLGGSIVLPTELYEINMEALDADACQSGLRAAPCLRQLFRALFVADILSDVRSVRLMATTVMALGHRDCGVGWFRPKLDYRVPARVKRQVISLSSDPALSHLPQAAPTDWEDYVWFQAPVAIKGFCK